MYKASWKFINRFKSYYAGECASLPASFKSKLNLPVMGIVALRFLDTVVVSEETLASILRAELS
jgi:hypothetical protein